jgi:hypothetical protein
MVTVRAFESCDLDLNQAQRFCEGGHRILSQARAPAGRTERRGITDIGSTARIPAFGRSLRYLLARVWCTVSASATNARAADNAEVPGCEAEVAQAGLTQVWEGNVSHITSAPAVRRTM